MIYDFNTTIFGEQFLPPYKRNDKYKSWIGVLLYPLQWLRDRFYDNYAYGNFDSYWDFTGTYTAGEVVSYLDYNFYVAMQNVPANTPCTDTNYWMLVSENVGAIPRANVTGQKLLLEWVLNKHFNTVFRQPIIGGVSDIHVGTFAIDTIAFTSGLDGTDSSQAAISGSDARSFVGESYTYDTESLWIYVPNGTLDTITNFTESAPYPEAQKVVLKYANKVIFGGIIAKVVPY